MLTKTNQGQSALFSESRLTLTQAPSTLWRWALKGIRGVKLETFVEGAQRHNIVVVLLAVAALLAAGLFCPHLGYLVFALPILGAATIYDEPWLTPNQVARKLGKSPSTIWRWLLVGVGPTKVKLESYMEGGQRRIPKPGLDRFRERCTQAASGEATSVQTPKQRQRAIDRAERELQQEGV